ncbi:tyrosine-type recombinase/integrase [Dyella agri]|uniref:Tyrosine-type recombinase/integrase n=1 Tax=Dyella agri TaxID=1926869 RepID=A0ABW8KIV4_9GAMM
MLLTDAVRCHLNALTAGGRSPDTVRCTKYGLRRFVIFLATAQLEHIEQLDHEALMRYREDVSCRLTSKGTMLSLGFQAGLLGYVRVFCRWMVAQDWLIADPSKRVPIPQTAHHLPKAIMEYDEVLRVLSQPDAHTTLGFRDRVIMEVLYSSGIRRAEVAHLRVDDVDTEHGFLIVREGKGRKDRAVPIGASVCALLNTYLTGIRPDWPGAKHDAHLFLGVGGRRLQPLAIGDIVQRHSLAAGLTKSVSTHSFRHACATHMLRAGASIRHIQELLGHASIDSTMIYTRVTINDLRAAHRQFHPREQDADNV